MLKNATVEEIDAILSFIISCGSSENRSEQKAAVEALISVNGLLKKEGLLPSANQKAVLKYHFENLLFVVLVIL